VTGLSCVRRPALSARFGPISSFKFLPLTSSEPSARRSAKWSSRVDRASGRALGAEQATEGKACSSYCPMTACNGSRTAGR
jgi:hypothetical protein